MSNKVKIAIIGAGMRGLHFYGQPLIKNRDIAQVVAVAEPNEHFRSAAASMHNITAQNTFTGWEQLLDRPRLADAVIIATPDALHKGPAITAANQGYHILLEKPMASSARDCFEIAQAVTKNKVLFAVCHVLRYAPYYNFIKTLLDNGSIGKICTIEHLEGVGWWHQAHSFVRGNWRNSKESSFMLLAKSCHDMDILHWWIDRRCLNISSFGHLKHFRKECKPVGSAERCMDCGLSDGQCAYSAKQFYYNKLKLKDFGWPLSCLVHEFTESALEQALRTGPYGRCVYHCDNDVVDHQVVAMEFEDQITAAFTMTAFAPCGRKTRIMGSAGYLEGNETSVRVLDFKTGHWTEYDIPYMFSSSSGNHGGGDTGLIEAFLNAVKNNDAQYIKTGPEQTLHSHLLAFAAETSRVEKRTVNISEFEQSLHLPTQTVTISGI